MVKSVEKAVKEVVEGKDQEIQLTFENGEEVIYSQIAGYSVNGDWVAVMTKEGTTHVHAARNIVYIRHYNI